jgi:hypothetical protein
MMRRPEFLDCPALLDGDGPARCGLPARIADRFTLESTDGPLDCATTRCPHGHWFSGPLEVLTVPVRTSSSWSPRPAGDDACMNSTAEYARGAGEDQP